MLNISAPELIKSFAETAPADVQQAVRATVVSLLGNLPPHMYDTSIASTGQNVASLMYSMQLTGYMFRSAEYRRSLMESLQKGEGAGLLEGSFEGGEEEGDEAGALPQVSGRIKVNLTADTQTEVDAAAYMAELRNEVAQLCGCKRPSTLSEDRAPSARLVAPGARPRRRTRKHCLCGGQACRGRSTPPQSAHELS